MRVVFLILGLTAILSTANSCDKKATTEKAKSEVSDGKKSLFGSLTSRTDPELKGTVRIADQSLRVSLFVSHDAHSDLKTNCLKAFDDAKKENAKSAVLCYDRERRDHATTLRIERYAAKGFEAARDMMAKKNEGAHFLLRSSGSVYQILDLAHAARRDGSLRPNEIRVMSAFPEKEEQLFEELKVYLPGLDVERVDIRNAQDNHVPPTETSSVKAPPTDTKHDEHGTKSPTPSQ